ncbi:hypothetical protein WJX81_000568 [Elliptochloris bilobata]|uniref:Uncharacterized protein n=1 Tax=Elliptochloris bilobata TaxID=381761 RepID=A0AAW1RLC9_9CHLO
MRCKHVSVLLSALCSLILLCQGSTAERASELFAEIPAGTELERMASLPTYVISAVEARWQRTRQVLATLHLQATRVVPLKPSARLVFDD